MMEHYVKFSKNTKLSSLALTLFLSASINANAAVKTFALLITVSSFNTCTVTATNLMFSPYNGAVTDTQNSADVICTNGVTYTVEHGGGHNVGGIPAAGQRRLINTSNSSYFLNYDLYSDAARTALWATSTQTGTGFLQSFPAYGRMPAGQTLLAPGAYTDSATVTITFTQ